MGSRGAGGAAALPVFTGLQKCKFLFIYLFSVFSNLFVINTFKCAIKQVLII